VPLEVGVPLRVVLEPVRPIDSHGGAAHGVPLGLTLLLGLLTEGHPRVHSVDELPFEVESVAE
jgi:hypothetical protein